MSKEAELNRKYSKWIVGLGLAMIALIIASHLWQSQIEKRRLLTVTPTVTLISTLTPTECYYIPLLDIQGNPVGGFNSCP